jgi:hypothetical protein
MTPVFAFHNASNCVLTPVGGAVGFSDGRAWWFAESSTGKIRGVINRAGPVSCAAWSQNGRQFALLRSTGEGPRLTIYEAAHGKQIAEGVPPSREGPVAWCGEKHLLIDNKWIVDAKTGQVTWSLTENDKEGAHLSNHTAGRHFWIDGENAFRSAVLPGDRVSAILAKNSLASLAALKPGDSVKVNFDWQVQVPDIRWSGEAERNFIDAVEARGFKVTPDAETDIRLRINGDVQTGSVTQRAMRDGIPVVETQKTLQPRFSLTLEVRKPQMRLLSRRIQFLQKERIPDGWQPLDPANGGNAEDNETVMVDNAETSTRQFLRNLEAWLPPVLLKPDAPAGQGSTPWGSL